MLLTVEPAFAVTHTNSGSQVPEVNFNTVTPGRLQLEMPFGQTLDTDVLVEQLRNQQSLILVSPEHPAGETEQIVLTEQQNSVSR